MFCCWLLLLPNRLPPAGAAPAVLASKRPSPAGLFWLLPKRLFPAVLFCWVFLLAPPKRPPPVDCPKPVFCWAVFALLVPPKRPPPVVAAPVLPPPNRPPPAGLFCWFPKRPPPVFVVFAAPPPKRPPPCCGCWAVFACPNAPVPVVPVFAEAPKPPNAGLFCVWLF